MTDLGASSGPRVLHVLDGPGADDVVARVAALVRRSGLSHRTTEFCFLGNSATPSAAKLRSLGCRVWFCPSEPASTFLFRFSALLRRGRFDVVRIHGARPMGRIAVLAAAAGVPERVVHAPEVSDATNDGLAAWLRGRLSRRLVERFSTVRAARSAAAAEACYAAADGVEIVPDGLDLDGYGEPDYRRADVRRWWGFSERDFVIGHAAPLETSGNQDLLLMAFTEARRTRSRLKLLLCGEGSRRDSLERLARDSGLSDSVVFLGRRDDVAALMIYLFDAFAAAPSIAESPPALLQAQAAGLPCLTSDRVAPEAIAVPELVRRLPLDRPPTAWAEELIALTWRFQMEPSEAVDRLRRAGLDVVETERRLNALIERRTAVRADASVEPPRGRTLWETA